MSEGSHTHAQCDPSMSITLDPSSKVEFCGLKLISLDSSSKAQIFGYVFVAQLLHSNSLIPGQMFILLKLNMPGI